jgi:hypothetical protein
MTMPCRWRDGLGDFAGRVRLVRHFGLPRQIDSHERLWLTFAGVSDAAEVWLNSQLLGRSPEGQGPFEFEVTSLLRERNVLGVEVEASGGDGGLWGEVALEVRCSAFLRGLRFWTTGSEEEAALHVAGEVAGVADRPLELYVLLNNATIAYTTVEAEANGSPFALRSEKLLWPSGQLAEVRVELVNGGTLWYSATLPFPFPDTPLAET